MGEQQRVRYLIEAVNKTQQPFKEVEGGLKELNKQRLEANSLVFAEQRAQQFLMSTYRQKYSAMFDTLGLMRSVGAIGNQIIGIVNSENLAQMRLRDSLLDVEAAQRMVNTALAIWGKDSPAYKQAWDDLTDAQQRYQDAADAEAWQDLAVMASLVGVVAQIGTLILKLGELGIKYTAIASLLSVPLTIAGGIVGGLAALGTMGGPETPGNLMDITPGGMEDLTKADIMAGLNYEDKYAVWRERQILGMTNAPSSPGEAAATGVNINVNVETNADPDTIADATIRAYENYRREAR